MREEWDVPPDASVMLSCAKVQPWKRPLDLLQVFARVNSADCDLVYAGDCALHGELKDEAANLGVAERVRFLGFMNQSQLPAMYRVSDLLVLPSEYEPFGLGVNEGMPSGCPAAVSDRVVAGPDLIRPENGFVFRCGEVDALPELLRSTIGNKETLQRMGKEHSNGWRHGRCARTYRLRLTP